MDLLTAPASYDMAPGFIAPAADSQAVFRAAMEAMARPGDVVKPEVQLTPPAPIEPAMAALALTLLDYETRFWIPDEAGDARGWIRFHTGARVARSAVEADFVFVPRGATCPALTDLRLGSDESPEGSATVILAVDGLGAGQKLDLIGPGIKGAKRLLIEGLAPSVLAGRQALWPLFPRGVDLIFTAGRKLAAIPRTTRVET